MKNKTIPLIVEKSSKYFEKVKKQVEKDFEKAKSENPDIIIVIPHMGTQFDTNLNDMQILWNEIFLDLGADLILGDHAHIVQKVECCNKNGESNIIVNCPR